MTLRTFVRLNVTVSFSSSSPLVELQELVVLFFHVIQHLVKGILLQFALRADKVGMGPFQSFQLVTANLAKMIFVSLVNMSVDFLLS